MRTTAFLMFFFLACGSLHATTYGFSSGEKPELSMQAAVGILEKHAKTFIGSDFNPRSMTLIGDSKPDAGAWTFIQADGDERVYQFIVYFPRDLCVVLDHSNAGFLGAFTREGEKVGQKAAGFESAQLGKDPFDKSPKDPFSVPPAPVKQIDPKVRAETLKIAARWVDAGKLTAFGEPAIGMIDPEKPSRRIFVDPSGERPTLFKWIELADPLERYLEVKQLTKQGDKWKLASKNRVAITDSQSKMLWQMMGNAEIETLPEPDWLPNDGLLDGSCWIYDFPTPTHSHVFTRRAAGIAPWKDDVYAYVNVSTRRLARENCLAGIPLMLWMISGLEKPTP